MISLLVSLLIAVLVFGILFYLIALLPIPQPFMNIAKAILALLVLLWLIDGFGVFGAGGHFWHYGVR